MGRTTFCSREHSPCNFLGPCKPWAPERIILKEGASTVGVFMFVIILVLIPTVGKLLTEVLHRARIPGPSPQDRQEFERLRESLDGVTERLGRLEEERDFYKQLLEAPAEAPQISPPEEESGEG